MSWHQDSTYWGLEPADVVTAWFAMSEASIESGAMRFILGSHKWEQLNHTDTFDSNNLLTRGQEIDLKIDEDEEYLHHSKRDKSLCIIFEPHTLLHQILRPIEELG
ncbi:MAG: hypothetical protein CM15mP62_32800 [Rhodospirillaceae bacterium]|nr:MAG: hypothetical protein CM15mP62_32800 [Rhodospirillaceae bacterium]